MNAAVGLIIISVLAALGPAVSAADEPFSCYYYGDANTTRATCNDLPGVRCSGGCRGSFVVAEGCTDDNNKSAPVTTQTCNIGFGRQTAAAKACFTTQGTFTCRGDTKGRTNCYGCAKTTN